MSTFKRAALLFSLGGLFTFVINVMQMEYKSDLFPHNVYIFLKAYWWVIPSCGLAAAYVGLMYPYIDHKFGECHHFDREWATILRCIALFFGLNHLCAKLTFSSIYHFSLLLMTFCLLFWYWFDKTKCGLLFTIFHALIVIFSLNVLRLIGLMSNINELNRLQFYYFQTSLLCFVFSGCITIGNIGRLMNQHKQHQVNHEHND